MKLVKLSVKGQAVFAQFDAPIERDGRPGYAWGNVELGLGIRLSGWSAELADTPTHYTAWFGPVKLGRMRAVDGQYVAVDPDLVPVLTKLGLGTEENPTTIVGQLLEKLSE